MTSALFSTFARAPLAFERGEGAWLYTASGEAYLDMMAGVAVNALGHAHPRLVEAMKRQAERLWHVSNIYEIPEQEELARRLTDLSFADRVFFCNSGAEAMECAIKTARRYHFTHGAPERVELITFEGAFHGRTLATLAAGGQEKYLEGFGPRAGGFVQVPFGDLDAVKAAIGPQTAGIIVEAVQGEGGVRMFDTSFLKALRQICDDNGILLVFDEVQTGIGRTGKFFAHEWSGVTPDVLAVAKGLGGGFPIGACLATNEAAAGMTPGTHGSTFGGNLLAMAAGNVVVDEVGKPEFLEAVRAKSLKLKQKLAGLVDSHPDVYSEVRGEGLLIGLKCKVPVGEVIAAMRDAHLLCVAAGDNVARFVPSLNVPDADIDEAVNRAERAALAIEAKLQKAIA